MTAFLLKIKIVEHNEDNIKNTLTNFMQIFTFLSALEDLFLSIIVVLF